MSEEARHLPVGYYLLNFETVLREVCARYGDLLHPEELERIEAFRTLPLDARRLYVRMLTRKGPWFREDRLRYREIRDVPEALGILLASGFCEGNATWPELLSLLVKEELIACLRDQGIPCGKQPRREALVQRLLQEATPPEGTLHTRLRPARLLHTGLWDLLCFLFFGNGEQDLSSFVLADLGRVQYEAYTLDPAHRLFQSRRDVDFLLSLRALREAFDAAKGDPLRMRELTSEVLAMEPHPGVRQQRRYHRLLNHLGREWERRKEPALALECYGRSPLPPSRERVARITADVPLAIRMAEAPLDSSEERFARVFLKRHRKAAEAGQWLLDHPATEPIPELHLALPRQPSVELAALEAARAEGWQGFFTENVLWNALFGLVFWEGLFAPVPGAFQHPFQSAPLDIGHPDFFEKRREALEGRLEEIQEGQALAQRVLATADAKWGLANAFLSWRHLTRDMLEAAVQHVPPPVLISVLRTMAQSPRAFASGFPDLFLFKPRQSEWALWEVKGPGDTLRPEQERWLSQFQRLDCEVRVARVKWEA